MPRQDDLLTLLGTPRWHAAAGARHDVPDNLPGYLLVHLAHRGDWIGRETLAGLFWPDRSDDDAQHNLRANLCRVRGLLGSWRLAERLETERRRVRLALPTDVAAFRDALGRADWAAASALQGEPLLAALSFRGLPLLEAWASTERQALAEAWHDAGLKAASAHERAGETDAAAGLLLRLLQQPAAPEEAIFGRSSP